MRRKNGGQGDLEYHHKLQSSLDLDRIAQSHLSPPCQEGEGYHLLALLLDDFCMRQEDIHAVPEVRSWHRVPLPCTCRVTPGWCCTHKLVQKVPPILLGNQKGLRQGS